VCRLLHFYNTSHPFNGDHEIHILSVNVWGQHHSHVDSLELRSTPTVDHRFLVVNTVSNTKLELTRFEMKY
jgi:hypothetical protein